MWFTYRNTGLTKWFHNQNKAVNEFQLQFFPISHHHCFQRRIASCNVDLTGWFIQQISSVSWKSPTISALCGCVLSPNKMRSWSLETERKRLLFPNDILREDYLQEDQLLESHSNLPKKKSPFNTEQWKSSLEQRSIDNHSLYWAPNRANRLSRRFFILRIPGNLY